MNFRKKFLTTTILGACIVATSPTAFAQDVVAEHNITTSDDIFELSLDQLLNMQITVASKKSEKISDAPGMITSYSKDDITRYGYYTLKDLANITSGYSTFSAYGETNLETRGQNAGSWNVSKHLLLVDGIPVNHSKANSAPLEYQIPLFFADRVEFLKGPGSALYGTSAFYGVMSITSKQLKEEGTLAESRISYGDAGNSVRVMGNASVKTAMGQANISFSQLKKGFSGDSLGYKTGNKIKHFNNDNSTFLNTSYKLTETKLKGLGIGMMYMRRNSHAGEFWGPTPSPNNMVTFEEVIPYMKYNRTFDKLTVNSYLKYNASTEASTLIGSWGSNAFDGFTYTTQELEGNGEVVYDINDNSSLIVGLNYNTRKESGKNTNTMEYGVLTTYDTISSLYTNSVVYAIPAVGPRMNIASGYLQYQRTFDVMKGLILTAGGRFDNGFSDAGKYHQLSPRLGLVLKTTDKFSVKALFGQALRVPGVKEVRLNAGTIEYLGYDVKDGAIANPKDIPSVRAEYIRSFETGVNYNTSFSNKSSLSLALAGFYNITYNSIEAARYNYINGKGEAASRNYFVNAGGNIAARGFEVDAQFAANENLRFMVNHAFAKSEIQTVLKDVNGKDSTTIKTDFTNVPTQKTNFSTTFVLPSKFRLSSTLVARHVWGFHVPAGVYEGTKSGNILGGYTMMDLNFRAPINEVIGVELQVRNVLDTKWLQPALSGPNYMIPLDRRNFLLTVFAKF